MASGRRESAPRGSLAGRAGAAPRQQRRLHAPLRWACRPKSVRPANGLDCTRQGGDSSGGFGTGRRRAVVSGGHAIRKDSSFACRAARPPCRLRTRAAVAMIVQGVARATRDVEIFVRPDESNVAGAGAALGTLLVDEPSISEITAEDPTKHPSGVHKFRGLQAAQARKKEWRRHPNRDARGRRPGAAFCPAAPLPEVPAAGHRRRRRRHSYWSMPAASLAQ